MMEFVRDALLLVGGLFALLAAVGITRMPDLFMRMQVSTKAATLGVGCLLFAVAVYFQDFGITSRAVLVIAFVFLTAPVAAHMIGRAAYFVGAPLWEGTLRDELCGHYDPVTHGLDNQACALRAPFPTRHQEGEDRPPPAPTAGA